MIDIEYRLLAKSERSAVENLWQDCFEDQDDPWYKWYFSNCFRVENTMAGFTDDALVAMAHLHERKIWLSGRVVACGLVMGVAVAPAYRNRGIAKELLRAVMVESRRRNWVLAVLTSENPGIYYSTGWEICWWKQQLFWPAVIIKSYGQAGGVWNNPDALGDLTALPIIYRRFMDGRNGWSMRSDEDWQHRYGEIAAEGGNIVIWSDDDGEPNAYVVYFIDADNKLRVDESAWTNKRAAAAICDFLGRIVGQADIELAMPINDRLLLPTRLLSQKIFLQPAMLGRVLAVRDLIDGADCQQGNGKLVLAVSDDSVCENNGNLSINAIEGKLSAEWVSTETAEANIDIGGLALLATGAATAEQLVRQGRLVLMAENLLPIVNKIFPSHDNYNSG